MQRSKIILQNVSIGVKKLSELIQLLKNNMSFLFFV